VASVEEVRRVVGHSGMPAALADELLDRAPALWLRGESPDIIAADVTFCRPMLGPGEVRVGVSNTLVPGTVRVAVLARDRPGLLATTTGTLAAAGLSVLQAAAITWPHRGWALQRVLAGDPRAGSTSGLEPELLRARLGAAVRSGMSPAVSFTPAGPVHVETEAGDAGRTTVKVAAPDGLGLLWAISTWFEHHCCNILVARASAAGEFAEDTFLVDGTPDPLALSRHLSGSPVTADAN
jgi:UTP:GlnB (protein PII) uridylyltransferase